MTWSPSAAVRLFCFRGSLNTLILTNNDALYNLFYFCFAYSTHFTLTQQEYNRQQHGRPCQPRAKGAKMRHPTSC